VRKNGETGTTLFQIGRRIGVLSVPDFSGARDEAERAQRSLSRLPPPANSNVYPESRRACMLMREL